MATAKKADLKVRSTDFTGDDGKLIYPRAHYDHIDGKPTSYTPTAHEHTIGEVTDLQTTLNDKLNLAGGIMTGAITMGSNNVTGNNSSIFQAGRIIATNSNTSSHGITSSGSRANMLYLMNGVTGGLAASLLDVDVKNTTTPQKRIAKIGIYGGATSGTEGTPSATYLWLSAVEDNTYNRDATLKVDSNDRIGIALSGTTRPAQALDVGGKIRMRTATVDTDGADIVVTKGYMLSKIVSDTNNYLTNVSGSGNGTVTLTRQGLSSLTWNATHDHNSLYNTKTEITSLLAGKQDALGYTAENSANKRTSIRVSGANDTSYVSELGVKTYVDGLIGSVYRPSGDWNATTNSPTLVNNTPANSGKVYRVSVAGTLFGFDFAVGDKLAFNESGVISKWDNIDDVVSVNGQTGTVALTTDNVTQGSNLYVSQTEKDTWSGKANDNEAVKLTTSGTTIQEIDSRIDISNTSIPFYSTRKTTVNGGIYATAMFTREVTTGTPAHGNGPGVYFRASSSTRAITHAGIFGGRLAVATQGATVGEIVLGPAWNGADPYQRSDFRVRARSASIADAYINGKFYSENTKEVATQEWVTANTMSNTWTPTWSQVSDKPSWIGSTQPSYTASEVGAAPTSHSHEIDDVTGLQTALNGKAATEQVVRATTENKNILGTTEEVFNISEKKVWFNKGALFYGTAAAAGLVTRGISGTTTAGSAKDHLYINYDGTNTLSRQLVLGAGSVGTGRGHGIYDYSAVRGDAFIAYLTGTLVSYTTGVDAKLAGKADATHNHAKAEVGLASVQDYGLAIKAEAEAGASNVKYMTPLRVKDAIEAQKASTPMFYASGFTLVLGHANKFLYISPSANATIIVPPAASVNFPIGTEIHIARYNLKEITIGYGSGVLIYSEGNDAANAGKRRINEEYQVVTLKKLALDTWLLFGALKV